MLAERIPHARLVVVKDTGHFPPRKKPEIVTEVMDAPNFYRKPYGAGWALVGDAGYHKDPATAQGVSDAFRDAEDLAEAIDAGFSGRLSLENGLANYERRRNDATFPMYVLTGQIAALDPLRPEMMQLHAALQGNPADTARFFGTLAGTVSIPEFFAPANIPQMLGVTVSA